MSRFRIFLIWLLPGLFILTCLSYVLWLTVHGQVTFGLGGRTPARLVKLGLLVAVVLLVGIASVINRLRSR